MYFEVHVVAAEFRRKILATAAPHFSDFFLMRPVQNAGHPNKQVCDDVTAIDLVQHFIPAAGVEIVSD